MTALQVLYNNDLSNEIAKYLPFESKIQYGRFCKKNFLRYYNVLEDGKIDTHIFGIFHSDDECEYIYCELSSYFCNELDHSYNDYCGYDIDDFLNDTYNNIPIIRYQHLQEQFLETFHQVYVRKFLEYIEDNTIDIQYSYDENIFELDNIDLFEAVIDYYKESYKNEDIEFFCEKCSVFGHHNTSKECLFYQKSFVDDKIKKDVYYELHTIINKIISIDEEEKRRILRDPLLCISCKKYNKKKNCIANSCASCCRRDDCLVHTKNKRSYNVLCLVCNRNQKHRECNSNTCRKCCNNEKCIAHKKYSEKDNI